MSPEERSLIRALVLVPGGPQPMASDEFLRRFGFTDGTSLGVRLLCDAIRRRDLVDVDFALIVCFRFGFTDEHLELLIGLAFADWHHSHEDVASALQDIRSPSSVDALVHLANWVPDYLDFDKARTLATKAIWALGATGGDRARHALERLSQDENTIVAEDASHLLELWDPAENHAVWRTRSRRDFP